MIARSRPTCYLHIGTHKTGTTSLQAVLAANDARFAQDAIYIPRAGRADDRSGHHNVAWELAGDPRFDPARGTWADVLAEITEHRAEHVCLSSEDFEYLHARPDALRTLADGLRDAGYTPVVIAYLRPQADYAESLYAELVRHGLTLSFDTFLQTIIVSGDFTFRQTWRFTFDYERLLDDFAAVFGADQIVARRYDSAAGDVVSDFLQLIGATPPRPGAAATRAKRLNSGLRFPDVLRLLEANMRRSHVATDGHALPVGGRGRFDPVGLAEVRQIVERFNIGNQRVYEKYGALVPCVSGRDLLADLATAVGIYPSSWYRKHVIAAQARRMQRPPAPTAPTAPTARMDRARELFAEPFRRPAQLEALIALTAALASVAALVFGMRVDSTALVEFGLLSAIVALAAVAHIVRYAVAARGIIADYRFFNEWAARLSVIGYVLVGLYAVVNAVLDIVLGRYEPDWISYPGTAAIASAALVTTLIAPARRRLIANLTASPVFTGVGDQRPYLTCCYIALLGQAAHPIVPDWWLDTLIDMLVVVFAALSVYKIRRALPTLTPF